MKNQLRIITSIAALTMVLGSSLFAQIDNVGKFLSGGVTDGEKILGAYIKPYTNAFGYDLNGGWYNTAKVHKLLGLDLTLTVNASIIPSSDNTFDLSKLGLTGKYDASIAPTISGKKTNGPLMTYDLNGDKVSYNTPQGTNWRYIPAPMAQLGVGLVKGTEIIGRYIPDIKIGSYGKVGAWGIGLKHSVKQWIPVIDRIPFLNLSVAGGYTQLHATSDLDFTPASINVVNETSGINFNNQQLDLKIKSFTADAVVSVDIPVITVYAGVGLSTTKTDIKFVGNYGIPSYKATSNSVTIANSDILKNNPSITVKPGMSPRVNAGLKFKLAVVTIHFDYAYSNYSVITAGLGISIR